MPSYSLLMATDQLGLMGVSLAHLPAASLTPVHTCLLTLLMGTDQLGLMGVSLAHLPCCAGG